MKKIILVSSGANGGAQRVAILIAKILRNSGFECLILFATDDEKKIAVKKAVGDIPYEVLQCKRRYLLYYLYNRLRREKDVILFGSLPSFCQLILILNMLLGNRFKVVLRETNTPSRHKKIDIWFARMFYRFADRLISQTKEMCNEMMALYHLPASKIVTINNPIDKELVHNSIKERYNMDTSFINYVAIGRGAPQKDLVTMIKAFAIVCHQQPNSRLYLVGNWVEEYRKIIDIQIKQYGLQKNVLFEGLQSNPFKYMIAANAFVMSSIYEGLPNAMIEAMYLGKPVVVTECIPYISQVVHNGINGYTTPVGDADAFAKAMLYVTKIKKIEKFHDVNNSEQQIIELFNSI